MYRRKSRARFTYRQGKRIPLKELRHERFGYSSPKQESGGYLRGFWTVVHDTFGGVSTFNPYGTGWARAIWLMKKWSSENKNRYNTNYRVMPCSECTVIHAYSGQHMEDFFEEAKRWSFAIDDTVIAVFNGRHISISADSVFEKLIDAF